MLNKKNDTNSSRRPLLPFLFLIVTLALASVIMLLYHQPGMAFSEATSAVYFPLTMRSARSGAPPSLYKSIQLEDAACPNDIAINRSSGYVYIANEYSDNVSVLQQTSQVASIVTGSWPVWVESDPLSDSVYNSNVLSGVTVLNSGVLTEKIEPYREPYNIVVNTVNGYVYIVDLHRPISIIRDNERIKDLFVPDYDGFQIVWQLASAFDEMTGLTYFASWQGGILTIVDELEVVDQFLFYGEGAKDMVIDAPRRLMYIANFRAGEDGQWFDNVSIVHLDTHQVWGLSTAKQSRHIGLDPSSGIVYVSNPADDSVSVLRGTEEVTTHYLGKTPWGVAVDPKSGFAYVANAGENSVSILRDGMPVTKIELPQGQGFEPWQIAVDSDNGLVYVVNRSSQEKHSDVSLDRIECREAWVHILR